MKRKKNRVAPDTSSLTSDEDEIDGIGRRHTFASTKLSLLMILLPISECLLQLTAFAICYIIALERREVAPPPYVPLVGDLVNTDLVRSIFTLCYSCFAHLSFLNYVLRYSYLKHESKRLRKINKCALALSLVSIIGGHLSVAFRTDTGVTQRHSIPHLIGAVLYIACTCVYLILHLWLSIKLGRTGTPAMMTRWVATVVALPSAVAFAVLIAPNVNDKMVKVPGGARIAGVTFWLFIASKSLFLLSFIDEFRRVSPSIVFRHFMQRQPTPKETPKRHIHQAKIATETPIRNSNVGNLRRLDSQYRRSSLPSNDITKDVSEITIDRKRRASLQPALLQPENRTLSTFTSGDDLTTMPRTPPTKKQWDDFRMLQIRAKQIREKEEQLAINPSDAIREESENGN